MAPRSAPSPASASSGAVNTPGFGADSGPYVAAKYDEQTATDYFLSCPLGRLHSVAHLRDVGVTEGVELDILDLGCGTGDITVNAIATTKGLVVAADVSTHMLDVLMQRWREDERPRLAADVRITHSHIAIPGFLDGAMNTTGGAGYDRIFLIRVLQHIGNDRVGAYLDELAGMLAPDGKIQVELMSRAHPTMLYAMAVVGFPKSADGVVDSRPERARLLGYFPCVGATAGVLQILRPEVNTLFASLRNLVPASPVRLCPHLSPGDIVSAADASTLYSRLLTSNANGCILSEPTLAQRAASGRTGTPSAAQSVQLMEDGSKLPTIRAAVLDHVRARYPSADSWHLLTVSHFPSFVFTLRRKGGVAARKVRYTREIS